MKVSIITATLPHPGRRSLLQETYASLLQQDIDWEWLIQVDQSPTLWPEGSPAPDLPRDNRICVAFNSTNLGLAKTRNCALERARGDLIAVLDDDDQFLPGSLTALSRQLELSGANWASASIWDFSSNRDGDSTRPLVPEGIRGPSVIPDYWSHPWDRFPLIPACSIFQRELVEDVGGWEHLSQGEDILFLSKIDALSSVLVVHMPFYRYRQHNQSFFSSTSAQHWWKYLNESSPEDFKQTRELVFMLSWRYLHSIETKKASFLDSVVAEYTAEGPADSVAVNLGDRRIVSRWAMRALRPEMNLFFEAGQNDLLCPSHLQGKKDGWQAVFPESRPEKIASLLERPEELPRCVFCGSLFLEVIS